jgi:NifU-like protein
MWEYTDKVMEHFMNPRNMGEIENPSAVGEVGSISCGDALKLMLSIDENEVITDAKFQTFGCASAIASSSALTEMIKGKTLTEAQEVTNERIAEFLGGLPREKMHCSVMGHEALEKALRNYRGIPEPKIDGVIVCECFHVTDNAIKRAVDESGLTSLEDVTNYLKAGGGCGQCHDKIQEIIDERLGVVKEEPVAPETMSTLQKIKRIEQVIEEDIRPVLRNDRGDIELVDVDGERVVVKFTGTCSGCKASQMTLNNLVQKVLREKVLPGIFVEEVS